jgi:ubiquinone biosynthesis protein COQ9
MDDGEFDKALVSAAFTLAGERGWNAVSPAAAALAAGLSLGRARERFPGRAAILLRFGRMADQAALASPPSEGTVRDRLFYLIMQRLDALQEHRSGVLALLRALPFEPADALLLDIATRRSMRWLLQAAGVSTAGVRGELSVRGLVGVWLWAVRAWRTDETGDMSVTMSAVDNALMRAERLAGWMGRGAAPAAQAAEPPPESEMPPEPEPPTPESPPPPTPLPPELPLA